jgi:hypothetical protein
MAAIVQRALSRGSNDDNILLTESEKQQLLGEIKNLKPLPEKNPKQLSPSTN